MWAARSTPSAGQLLLQQQHHEHEHAHEQPPTLSHSVGGICVDLHVHRIANRLKWVKSKVARVTCDV